MSITCYGIAGRQLVDKHISTGSYKKISWVLPTNICIRNGKHKVKFNTYVIKLMISVYTFPQRNKLVVVVRSYQSVAIYKLSQV